ncbi:uncharacterized protein [Branchiostoma lanceolatum]|uniref:uncharacterized protein n=1 Tax=Branchiostoma lanceolatum TaxID=7740 RepID=UPI00345374BF
MCILLEDWRVKTKGIWKPLPRTLRLVTVVTIFAVLLQIPRGSSAQAVQCPILTAPAHGSLSPVRAHFYQDVVTFSCDVGYEINGASTVSCQADGTWSNPVPTCLPRQCPVLTAPANGVLHPIGAKSYRDKLRFTCNSGYLLNGATNTRCQADGTWSNPVPACTDIDECKVNPPCDMNATCINTDGSFLCECNIGYEEIGFKCTDIDECSGDPPCDRYAECTNTDGSFLCQCDRGYFGNGFSCTAGELYYLAFLLTNPRWTAVFSDPQLREELTNYIINTLAEITTEIQESIGDISVLALKPGSVIAVSQLNMTTEAFPEVERLIVNSTRDGGFGTEPVDPSSVIFGPPALIAGDNECQNGTHNCDHNAICSDKYVGFVCSCRQGFAGDGLVCKNLFPTGTELGGEQGYFISPLFPNHYPDSLRHKWTIRAPDPNKVIRLRFTEFHLEGAKYGVCLYDKLSVYDGEVIEEKILLETFCGSELPEPLTSTGSVMTLILQTDEQESFLGFNITYQQIDKEVLDFKLGQFACVNAQGYIIGWQRCNEHRDCRDSSDEQNCECRQFSNLDLGICKGLDYRDVLLPNWVGYESVEEIQSSAELHNLTQYYRQDSPCHAQFVDYVCALLFPRCDRTRLELPCRSWCVEVQQACGAGQVPGLEKTFRACDLLPSSQCYSQPTPNGRDCFYGNGENYQGNRSISTSGDKCEPWSEAARLVTPSLLEGQYNWANLQDSYCRNPYSSPEPWCYVKDSEDSLVPATCSVDPCQGVCESPANPENGRRVPVKGAYRAGDRVSFRCNEGYRVTSGEQDAYCQQNGTWTSPPPECLTDGRARLTDELFDPAFYNPAFPPDVGTVVIFFRAALIDVIELKESDEQILSSVVFRLIWNDRRLQWQNSRYPDVQEIRVSEDQLWRPALALVDNANIEFEGFQSSAGVRVFQNGEVVWDISQIFQTTCNLNTRDFPFDEMECSTCIANEELRDNEVLRCLGSDHRPVHSSRIDLTYCDVAPIEDRVDQWNTKWEIDEQEEGNYTKACIKLHMRRDPTYHLCITIGPSILLALLMAVTFLLPLETGERLGYAMTIFLSMVVTLIFITEVVPAEESLPVIAVVVLIYISMMVVWMLLAVFSIRLSNKDGTLPCWARALFLRHLARFLLLGDLSKNLTDDKAPKSVSVDSTDKSRIHNAISEQSVVYYFNDEPAEREKLHILQAIKQLLTELQANVKSLREKGENDLKEEEPETDYCNLAHVVDRICFVTYIVGVVIAIPLTSALSQ